MNRTSPADYADFLGRKLDYGAASGFEPVEVPPFLFPFQAHLLEWALRKGRAAVFADCGLGKTAVQLAWADNVIRRTNRPVLVRAVGVELKPAYYRQAVKNLATVDEPAQERMLFDLTACGDEM